MTSNVLARTRRTAACLLLLVFAFRAGARGIVCDICGEPINGPFYMVADGATGEQKNVCQACRALESKCFICGLPVKEGYLKLADGRYLCARDKQGAIGTDEEVREVASNVRDDLDRLLSRFLTIPESNVVIAAADKYQLETLFHAPGYQDACVTIYGATKTSPLPDGRYIHHICLLSHLQRARLMAVCAHEFTHAWMGENVSHDRKALLDHDTIEGFCELVAYKYVASRQETAEMETIQKNNYTKGQIQVLIQADKEYGFDAVMEWIKSGEDNRLDLGDLDRVRAIHDANPASLPAIVSGLLYVPPTVPSPVPDTLQLKGISGVPHCRFALINDATFQVSETWRVRVGLTNVMVQCIEIRDDSVLIRLPGVNERKVLVLRAIQ